MVLLLPSFTFFCPLSALAVSSFGPKYCFFSFLTQLAPSFLRFLAKYTSFFNYLIHKFSPKKRFPHFQESFFLFSGYKPSKSTFLRKSAFKNVKKLFIYPFKPSDLGQISKKQVF